MSKNNHTGVSASNIHLEGHDFQIPYWNQLLSIYHFPSFGLVLKHIHNYLIKLLNYYSLSQIYIYIYMYIYIYICVCVWSQIFFTYFKQNSIMRLNAYIQLPILSHTFAKCTIMPLSHWLFIFKDIHHKNMLYKYPMEFLLLFLMNQ